MATFEADRVGLQRPWTRRAVACNHGFYKPPGHFREEQPAWRDQGTWGLEHVSGHCPPRAPSSFGRIQPPHCVRVLQHRACLLRRPGGLDACPKLILHGPLEVERLCPWFRWMGRVGV